MSRTVLFSLVYVTICDRHEDQSEYLNATFHHYVDEYKHHYDHHYIKLCEQDFPP